MPNIDPLIERKLMQAITGAEGTGNLARDIEPSYPLNRARWPLHVAPRGWWTGGLVEDNVETSKTQTLKSGGVAGVNDGSTIYTVTTGKTFYCTGAAVGGAGGGNGKLTANATDFCNCRIPAAGGNVVFISGNGAPLFSATGAITITGMGVGNNVGFIWGWEE